MSDFKDKAQSILDDTYQRLLVLEQERNEMLFRCCKVLLVALRDAGHAINDLDAGDTTSDTGWKSDEALAAWEAVNDTFATVTKILSKEFKQ